MTKFKFGGLVTNRQFTKLPNLIDIRYIIIDTSTKHCNVMDKQHVILQQWCPTDNTLVSILYQVFFIFTYKCILNDLLSVLLAIYPDCTW